MATKITTRKVANSWLYQWYSGTVPVPVVQWYSTTVKVSVQVHLITLTHILLRLTRVVSYLFLGFTNMIGLRVCIYPLLQTLLTR